MAEVKSYTDSILPQGQLNAQASPEEFGAGVGQAIKGFGQAIRGYEQAVYENDVRNDVTSVHVNMAKKRAEWQQRITDMANNAPPGDTTFQVRVMEEAQRDLESLAGGLKTQQGKQTLAVSVANMVGMFGQEAAGLQARMNGEFAKNQYVELSDNLSSIAAKDHTQFDNLVVQGISAIDDPNGRFALVPESTREAFRQSITQEISLAAAKGFARKYPNAVLGNVAPELRSSLQIAVANSPTPGVPPDLGADKVKPYNPAQISGIAKQVAQPSPYDDMFKDAARLYNLDWRELKMRAVAESGLNPTAVSSQNAGGIMQMTPETAAKLGVDRNDPSEAIFGAAKLIAGYRAKANGDMVKVDMMYYGGESGTEWGANTKQYAANLSAVRGLTGLGSGASPEQFAPTPEMLVAANMGSQPTKTGYSFIDGLPGDKMLSVLTEAEHYQRAHDTLAERSYVEAKKQRQQIAEAALDRYTQRVLNPSPENGGPVNEIEIAGDTRLDSGEKQHMMAYINQYTRERQSGQEAKSNPENVRGLMLRIYAADNDPDKLYDPTPLRQALAQRQITTAEFGQLNRELNEMKSSSTNGFRKDVNNIMGVVERSLQQNMDMQMLERTSLGATANAVYQFKNDLENQITAFRAQNKDPRVLLDPTSPEYVLKPGRLNKFVPDYKKMVGDAAAKAVETEKAALPTYNDYDSLKAGASYTDPQGNVKVKQ